ncbi:xylulokinase [Cnuibacter physcomitrellae]|uniref:Xylulose kinase n=1 Tax=Cnuibacter physcomitrellae TaxID=1619308 RepID=A0A1X9LGD9_9MICO|nr:xylulokinase [Cnuibacter physcomitrellae]ARJ04275.1 xylulokinase [Cnuibacter physcomitrellae]GGI40664.1 xylulokinase [Cnuibacter physcomitrellae]
MPLVAGVDSSTQSCKVVVRDAESGELVRSGRAAHPAGTEVDPQHWWDALRAALDDAGGLADVAAISVAGQQHGMVVLDADGRVIRPALLWNDTRSAAAASALIDEFGAEALASRTGSVPVASFTATKLRWLRDAEPSAAERVAAVALPHDWLTWRLRGFGPTGESPLGPVLEELVTDRSDASGTSYWNPATGDYDRELLLAALGHDAVLPRVLGPLESAGTTAAAPSDGVPAGIVVGPGAGDNAGAARGLGAGPGDAIISIGTSGTVFAVTPAPSADGTGAVAGFADASGVYLPLIATLNAARILDSIAALLGVDHAELGDLALTAPAGADGLVLQPYFEGERTPNLPDATATLFGMTIASTTRPGLARAAIEGMLCGLADGLDALRAVGVRPARALLIGGAALNPAVQRIAAEVFDVPIAVPTPGEYVADGAALQAAAVLAGAWPTWPLALETELAPATVPLIRSQYAARRPA